MTPTEPDYATPYRELRERVSALVRERETDVDTIAPATPEWRVRDVLCHMVGVCDDIVSGNLEGVASDAWTKAQVDKRCDLSVSEILDEWAERGPTIEQLMTDAPNPAFGQMVYDAVTHEHDIRGALDESAARDSSAIATAFEWAISTGIGEALAGDGTFTLATEAEPVMFGEGEPTLTLRASRFEVIRSLTGRRSLSQMRAFGWDGEPKPEQLVFSPLFQPRATDLIE